jgi:multidrug transporter EmrE-like cation transporter
MSLYKALVWTTATSLVEALGLYWLRVGSMEAFLKATLAYGLGVTYFLSRSLKYEGIGMTNFLWNVMSTMIGFGIGIFLFQEQVHYLQTIGVVLGLLGVGLIAMAPERKG